MQYIHHLEPVFPIVKHSVVYCGFNPNITKFDGILAIHIHLNRLVAHHTIRYIGRIIPFLIKSSPSSTTVLEKYTTILHYAKTIGNHHSTGICVLCTPSQLPFSIVRMRCLTRLQQRCNVVASCNGNVVNVVCITPYCITTIVYYTTTMFFTIRTITTMCIVSIIL